MKLHLNESLGEITLETTESAHPQGVIIIGHGAGAGMHHPFMVDLASELAEAGLHAVRFNFPYMESGRRSPGSPKKNIETWQLVVDHVAHQHPSLPIFVSGKSYGGRMASHLIAESHPDSVKGIVYFGFPLHAPGRDGKERAEHLDKIKVPQLFLQGEKDKLANIQLMGEVVSELNPAEMVKIDQADHSFNVPKSAGISKKEMISLLARHTYNFIKNL